MTRPGPVVVAPVHGRGEVAAVVGIGQGQPLRDGGGGGGTDVVVDEVGSDHDAGVEQVAGVEGVLDPAEQFDRRRAVHQRQQFAAGPAVAVLTGQRAPVLRHQPGRVQQEYPHHRLAVGLAEREVEPQVHAALAEVAVGRTGQAALGHQRVEVTQVAGERFGRHGRVLPAWIGRRTGLAAAGQAHPLFADPPQRGRLGGVGDHHAANRVHGRDKFLGRVFRLRGGVAGDLDEQPRRPGGQVGHPARAAAGPHHVHQA
jgi:hypothetical protein